MNRILLSVLFCFASYAMALDVEQSLTDGSYRKSTFEYVNNDVKVVRASCQTGDQIEKRGCLGDNVLKDDIEQEPSIFFDSTDDTDGISCRLKLHHPAQVVRVTSWVTCKKSS